MNATVSSLTAGDLIVNGPMSATFICQTAHPLYPGLRLVIWKLADGSWSFDALSIHQEVGEWADPGEPLDLRKERLARALLSPENATSYIEGMRTA